MFFLPCTSLRLSLRHSSLSPSLPLSLPVSLFPPFPPLLLCSVLPFPLPFSFFPFLSFLFFLAVLRLLAGSRLVRLEHSGREEEPEVDHVVRDDSGGEVPLDAGCRRHEEATAASEDGSGGDAEKDGENEGVLVRGADLSGVALVVPDDGRLAPGLEHGEREHGGEHDEVVGEAGKEKDAGGDGAEVLGGGREVRLVGEGDDALGPGGRLELELVVFPAPLLGIVGVNVHHPSTSRHLEVSRNPLLEPELHDLVLGDLNPDLLLDVIGVLLLKDLGGLGDLLIRGGLANAQSAVELSTCVERTNEERVRERKREREREREKERERKREKEREREREREFDCSVLHGNR